MIDVDVREIREEISQMERSWLLLDDETVKASTPEKRRMALQERHNVFIGVCILTQKLNEFYMNAHNPVRDIKKDCERNGHMFATGKEAECIKCGKNEKEFKEEEEVARKKEARRK
jgi:hypothetical protein